MTRSDYTAVALLVDRSGSMSRIRRATEDSINEFVASQAAKDGVRTLRLVQFDDEYEVVFPTTPAVECPKFKLEPRGCTALFDAIGRTINEFGEELAALPEDDRPANVVVGIMTDGAENASIKFDRAKIMKMVRHQEKTYGWNFLFMGANQDAIETGAGLGMRANSSITYAASSVGTRSVLNTMDGYVTAAASGINPTVSDTDRKNAMEED